MTTSKHSFVSVAYDPRARERARIARSVRVEPPLPSAPSELHRKVLEMIADRRRSCATEHEAHTDVLTSLSSAQRRLIPICAACGFVIDASDLAAHRRGSPDGRPTWCGECAEAVRS